MIDTHCHLTFPDFEGQIPDVIQRAAAHGVSGMITISTTTADCSHALMAARLHDRVWCSAGVHPLYADRGPHDWDRLARVARDEHCIAWGELGLDNHYDRPPRDTQRKVLTEQLARIDAWHADGIDLPVILHCREAFDDLIPFLKDSSIPPERFVFHCFTGTPEDMRKVLDFGAMVSFTGVVTYKNAREVQEAARLAPPDRIMVETDAPFLSPQPRRGVRPCEPWMASLTAKFLADLRGQDWDRFHHTINHNTTRFFNIPAE